MNAPFLVRARGMSLLTRCGVALMLGIGGAVSPHAQAPERGTGPLSVRGFVRVIEGDTLEVRINGARVGIAIAGITTPAGNTPCGRAAINATQELVAGGVDLEEDLALPTFDNRLLRIYRVVDASGRLVSEELARAGFAVPSPQMRNALDRPLVEGAAAEAAAGARGCVGRPGLPR
jgi:endonuclease YncB( thermonuclease family)